MELALITVKQVSVLFILIFAGFLSVRLGVIKIEWKGAFSNLLLYLVTPCLVLNSYFSEFNPEIFGELVQTFLWAIIIMTLGIIITVLSGFWIKDANKGIIEFACSFSNAAYMGFPLIGALFGDIGLLYASAFFTVFNILLWTVGYGMVSGSTSPKSMAKSIMKQPVIYVVILGLIIYLCRVNVPEIIRLPISSVGSMNTPLSMIITGMIIAGTDFRRLLKNKHLFFIIAVRMIIVPAVCFVLLYVAGIRGNVASIVLLLEACPTAAITSVFAVQFKRDEDLAAGAVVITTFLSIITLPVFALLLGNLQ